MDASSLTSRRLAAVWFADIVGYSRLSAGNEPAALQLVELFQASARQEVARCGGRLVKFLGDGALAEFPSADAAVRAALALVPTFTVHSAAFGQTANLRVAVHVGEVTTAADGDIYGDGVNITSRLQQVANQGGVVVSEDGWRQLRQRPEFGFEPLGVHKLKGLPTGIRVFRVLPADGAAPYKRRLAIAARHLGLGRSAALLALLAGAAFAGYWGLARDRAPADSAIPSPRAPAHPLAARSIAVLPFINLSPDPDIYFSDGITEEVINALANVEGLQVASRTSASAFKDQRGDIREIGQKLNVATVLEGSVRQSENQVRITAQLINVADGYHLWSQTFDRELGQPLAIQDEVSQEIARAIETKFAQLPEWLLSTEAPSN